MPVVEMRDDFLLKIDTGETITWGEYKLRHPAPQAQPDARAWLVQEFNHDDVLRSEFAVVGECPWSGKRGADRITVQPLYLSAPAADDGWRPSREGVARIIEPNTWQNIDYWLSEKPHGGPTEADCARLAESSLAKADAILALHPAAPTDEVGKS